MSEKSVWNPNESFKTGSEDTRRRQEAYIDWVLTPEAEREPSTKRELAEFLGVTTQTLRNYAKSRFVQQELQSRAKGLAKVERVPKVVDALYHQALDVDNPRSVAASKLLLDWTERMVELGSDKNPEDMTDDEVFAVARRLNDFLNRR